MKKGPNGALKKHKGPQRGPKKTSIPLLRLLCAVIRRWQRTLSTIKASSPSCTTVRITALTLRSKYYLLS